MRPREMRSLIHRVKRMMYFENQKGNFSRVKELKEKKKLLIAKLREFRITNQEKII
jgi:hypothetical protein